jgi:hypothetical protein
MPAEVEISVSREIVTEPPTFAGGASDTFSFAQLPSSWRTKATVTAEVVERGSCTGQAEPSRAKIV